MSMFSEYLHLLIQNRNVSIAGLSRDSGVERTTIHKALTGSRILPYQAVELLAYHLKLSPQEGQKLRQYYNLLFEKEGIYRSRQIIDDTFMELSDMKSGRDWLPAAEMAVSEQGEKEQNTFRGYSGIMTLLQSVFEEEMKQADPRVEIAAPVSAKVIGNSILNLYFYRQANIKISHIICFDTSTAIEEYNLRNLESFRYFLPACLFSGQQYHLYYYYNDAVNVRYVDPLPYYIVTHSGVICLSENCQTAIYLREKEMIEYFRSCFYHTLSSCHELAEYVTDSEEVEQLYNEKVWDEGCYLVSGQPCMVKVCVQKGLQEKGKCYTFFPKIVVEKFMETGLLSDDSQLCDRTLKKEDRLSMLRKLIEAISEDRVTGRLLNDMTFIFPDYLSVLTSVNNGMMICKIGPEGENGRSLGIRIVEPELCRTVHHWLLHLPESEHTLDREKTVEILKGILLEYSA